ncbi:MAG: phospholipid carrier-dependent glycosyltransferase [Geobacteraceae bacterium]|nr:phospholipid carrier-dependent glycosyltransferase [Geobacteraceae bacterium]
MTRSADRNGITFVMVIIYAILAMGWNLDYGSVFHDEALNIRMGGEVLNGGACPNCAQNTGTVLIHPVLAYLGDAAGGLAGARGVSALFGVGLVIAVYRAAKILFCEKLAFFAALLLLFTGTVMYLAKLATYDMPASFFLALSFLMIVKSITETHPRTKNLSLAASAISLFVAGITKYLVAIFWIPLAGYACWKHKFPRWLLCFLLPFASAAAIYGYLALLPALPDLAGSATTPYKEGYLARAELWGRFFRWLSVPYILAFFSSFHENREWRKLSFQFFLLSTPAVLFQLIMGDGRSLDKNVLFALVFLAPSAAVGLDHMGELFSTQAQSRWVKPFCITLLLVVLWASGLTDLSWLKRHFPDVTPVVQYFERKGFEGMKVAIDSDYGDPDNIYRYSLGKKYPGASFYSMSYVKVADRQALVSRMQPDFLVFDEYYSSESLVAKLARYSEQGYVPVETIGVKLPWGAQTVQILHRR